MPLLYQVNITYISINDFVVLNAVQFLLIGCMGCTMWDKSGGFAAKFFSSFNPDSAMAHNSGFSLLKVLYHFFTKGYGDKSKSITSKHMVAVQSWKSAIVIFSANWVFSCKSGISQSKVKDIV